MKALTLTLLCCCIFGISHAQYIPIYTQDLYKPSHYNSAAMGLDKGMYWGSSNKAPINYDAVFLHFRFNETLKKNDRIAIGGKIDVIDEEYYFTGVTFLGRVAYHLVQTEKHDLSLGMEAGFYSLSYRNLSPGSDVKVGFDAQVGGHYQLSLKNINLKVGQGFSNLGRLKDNSFFYGALISHSSFSTKFIVNDWGIEPLVLFRSAFQDYGNSLLLDVGARFSYKDLVWLGSGFIDDSGFYSYHIDLGVSPSFGNTRKNQLQIFFSVLRDVDFGETVLELGVNYLLGHKNSVEVN